MSLPSSQVRRAILVLLYLAAQASGLTLDQRTETRATLAATVATLNGRAELHLTAGGDPIPGSQIHLNSEDAWLFFHGVAPSAVVSNLLPRLRVNGAPAVNGSNVRVVQHGRGAVVIPHPADFQPLTVFSGRHLTGASMRLSPHTAYGVANLGPLGANIRSFRLKRGYTATFAQNENGTGFSRNYVAQDSDIELSIMPGALDGPVRFVRVFPWRWTGKKGSCDVSPTMLDADWHYNWDINRNSALDWEYVAIRQQRWWPGLGQDWRARGIHHLLGYNEPDNPVEDAYQTLNNGSVDAAIAAWPDLLATGLRVGAPAVTDAGRNWLYQFMDRANEQGLRVDYVPIHYYRSYWNKDDPAGAANQMYQFLREVHERLGKPIWVTEFNNGANWTDNNHDPNVTQNRNAIEAMIRMMDETPWIERYAIYSRVEWFRQTHYDSGGETPMGTMYRNHVAPIGYVQEVPNSGTSGNAAYLFEGHVRDSLSGNNALVYGTPAFVPGRHGSALSFDGEHDHLVLPGRLGDSDNFSFAAWVKWDGGPNWQRIFDLGNGTNHNMFLTPRSGDGTLRFAIKAGGAEQRLNAAPLTPGVWTHVAVSISDGTGRLFVNGAQADVNPGMSIRPAQVGTETNYLGKSQWPDPLYRGLMDDVRFFNSGLSAAELSALAASTPPELAGEPDLPTAEVGRNFRASLASLVAGGGDGVRFSRVDGPAWLALAGDGSLSGVPTLADVGTASLLVRASAPGGAMAFFEARVTVAAGDPVARYPFDGSARSAVGGADAQLQGGPLFVAGRLGQALLFDGVDDHVRLPVGVATADELSFAAWVRWNGGGNWQRIFDFGNGTGSYLFLTPRSGGNTLRFAIRNGSEEQQVQTSILPTGVWTHLAVTLGADGGRIYVNGGLAAENPAMTMRPSDFRPGANFLGRSQFAADPYFAGRMDEVQVFHRALAVEEIVALRDGAPPQVPAEMPILAEARPGEPYVAWLGEHASGDDLRFSKAGGPTWLVVEADGRISGTPGTWDGGGQPLRVRVVAGEGPWASEFSVRVPVPHADELLARYDFDGDTLDSAGGRHATAAGGTAFVPGPAGQALGLDGANGHVRFPADLVSDLGDSTFAVRFRWDGGSNWQRVLDLGNNTSQYLFLTPRSAAGTMRFGITTGGSGSQQFVETESPPVGVWTHVALVFDGGVGRLFVNGSPAASAPMSLRPSDLAPSLNYLGRSQWASDPYFNGAIDDFQIIRRALDASEVMALAVPAEGVAVERDDESSSYQAWAAALPFPDGLAGPMDDPDGDGVANLIEWLVGSDPLAGLAFGMPVALLLDGAELGREEGGRYLALRVRVRKERPGVEWPPEAALELADCEPGETPQAMGLAGPAENDGDFEILTWVAELDSTEVGRGFARLRVRLSD